MNSYDRIYSLLTEVKTPRERKMQIWSSLTTDGRKKDLNTADYDMEKIKKARDPNNPLNRESPPGGDVESRIKAGRGVYKNPDDFAQYIAMSHGESKRERDLARRDRLKKEREPAPEPTQSPSLLSRIKARFKGKRR